MPDIFMFTHTNKRLEIIAIIVIAFFGNAQNKNQVDEPEAWGAISSHPDLTVFKS